MDKVGDLMRELGFKEDGPEEVKKAFIMRLFKAAYPNAPLPPFATTATPLDEARADRRASVTEEQLAFNFDAEGPCRVTA